MTLSRWAAVGVAVIAAALVLAGAVAQKERRAKKAEAQVVAIGAAHRAEAIRADSVASVALRGSQAAGAQIRVERTTQTIIREIEASPDASTPIPPDLARAWVAGLGRLCDDAGPGACADAQDRPDAPTD